MHFRLATDGRKYDECSEFEESCSQIQQNRNVIDIGLQAELLVNTTNRTCQGFILICHISSLFSITNFAFQLVANISLNETHSDENRVVLTFLYVHALLLYLVRLDILMRSGQTLENQIKVSKRALEDIVIKTPLEQLNDEQERKISVLTNRLQVYQFVSPIAPYSVFSLNCRTFWATLATMITYMVVLIKLRGSATTSRASPLSGNFNITTCTV